MRAKDLWGARDEAATEILDRMRRDAEGTRWQTRAFLAYLNAHLFDETVRVGRAMEVCRITDTGFSTYFHAEVGCPPAEYIRRGRMEVAARLLRDGDWECRLVGEAVGIVPATRFTDSFRRWFGETPNAYRAGCRAGDLPELPLHDPLFGKDAFAGKLERRQAELYWTYLHDLYGLPALGPPPFEVPDPEFYDAAMARVVWRQLAGKPFDEQKKSVCCPYGFRTPALFHLLLAKSRETGRCDTRRAVELAELALASLDAVAADLRGALPDLRARGWAWFGNTRRRALDFPGADEAFARAENAWKIPRAEKDQLALAEIYDLKAALRADQRRFDEALALADQGVELLRSQGTPERLAEALIARGTIVAYNGDPEETFGDFEEALEILDTQGGGSSFLRLSAVANLAAAYALSGCFEEPEELLAKAEALARETPDRTSLLHLQWTAALVAQGRDDRPKAEDCFREALQGFIDLAESYYAAVVAIELAVLYAEEDRGTEAIELAAGTIPFFEAFKNQREATAALELIQEAVAHSSFAVPVGKELRAYLNALWKDPLFPLWAREKGGGLGFAPKPSQLSTSRSTEGSDPRCGVGADNAYPTDQLVGPK
ncbi:MAG: helix-turn-helix transcriptional regulator [bacterium]|nr:helix-turn-helix transcriptional regulator [bacterium]